jgi:hypothetical protein
LELLFLFFLFFKINKNMKIYRKLEGIIKMGGTQSTSIVNSLTSACVNATQTSTAKCITTASQEQSIMLQAAGDITVGDISQVQAVSVKSECLFSSQVQSDIQNAVANTLAQAAEAAGSGITSAIGGSSSNTFANIYTMISANVKQEQIQEAVNNTMQRQTVSINAGGNIIAGNISQEQTAKLIAKAIMNSEGYSKVINEVANQIDQSAKAKTTNPLADIIGSVGDLWGKPILYIVLAVIAVAVMGALGAIFGSRRRNREKLDKNKTSPPKAAVKP